MGQVVNRLKAADLRKTTPGVFADGNGLYLRITEGKEGICRSWIYRYSRDEYTTAIRKDGTTYRRQKEGVVGLGPHPQVSLEDARAAAREIDRKRRSGEDRDPAKTRREVKEARRAEKDEEKAAKDAEGAKSRAPTVDRCIDAYVDNNRSRWTSWHHAQVKDSLVRFVAPIVGHLPADQVTITHVIAVLKPIWTTIPETARRTRARLQAVLDLGYSLTYPDDHEAAQALVDRNPARISSHLKHILGHNNRAKKPFAALDYRQAGTFMGKLRAIDTAAARCLEFCVLTAARSAQTIEMTWAEIDFNGALWTVDGSRMKNRKEHVVPLSTRALEILRQMESVRSDDRVFASVSRVGMWTLLKSMPEYAKLSVHGFRSCFKDYCSDVLDVDDMLSETALAHSNSDATWRAYRRKSAVEKRRVLMQQWCHFCAVDFKSNVTPLPVPERAA
jgi:integrase